jgi:polysaccharide biosynthesis protein PslG
MATRTSTNNQIRSFAFIWIGITLMLGIAAFLAIYLAYEEPTSEISIPQADLSQPTTVMGAATPVPTLQAPATATEPPTATPTLIPTAIPMIAQVDDPTATTPPPTQTPTTVPTMLPVDNTEFAVGIQIQPSITFTEEYQRGWFGDAQGLGLNWYKQQVRWQDFEPEKGEYDWGQLDFALPIASDMGFNVLISVIAAPEWARTPGLDMSMEGPPANMQDFINFLDAMLKRYPGQIHAIEVWNEPNLDREWMTTGGVSAPHYMEMLQLAYNIIKANDPGIIVISGALSPTGGAPPLANGAEVAIDDFSYLDSLLANGMLDYSDCMGVHHNGINVPPSVTWDNVPDDPDASYRGPFENPHHSWSFRSTLETYADKIAATGAAPKLCITEFGWPSVEDLDGPPRGDFSFALDNTLQEQADWTVEALTNMEEWGFVWLAMIWNLNYGPQAGFNPENDNVAYSFLGPNFTQRPVMAAVRAWSAAREQEPGQ